jgi:acyl carrier protein
MGKESFMEDLAAILEVEPAELHEGFELDRDNWNSLAIVTAIVLLDEEFGITIEGEKLRECASVGALWNLIEIATTAKGAGQQSSTIS